MTKVKICGVTNLDDALMAARAGADFLGLNFYKPSPRYLEPDEAGRVAAGLRVEMGDRTPLLVGVFVDEPLAGLQEIADKAGLDFLQLHGDEPPQLFEVLGGRAFKAIRPQSVEEAVMLAERYAPTAPQDERAPSLLVDAYHPSLRGGTGEQANAEIALAVMARVPRLMLAGGLTPENVAGRVKSIKPWAVDTASGVESGDPRKKDYAKVKSFVEALRVREYAATEEYISNVEIPELQLYIEVLGGISPMTGWGTLAGKQWEFYSRFDSWWFCVALESGLDTMDFLYVGAPMEKFFVIEETYGPPGSFAASYMLLDEAIAFVTYCAGEFLESPKNR